MINVIKLVNLPIIPHGILLLGVGSEHRSALSKC